MTKQQFDSETKQNLGKGIPADIRVVYRESRFRAHWGTNCEPMYQPHGRDRLVERAAYIREMRLVMKDPSLPVLRTKYRAIVRNRFGLVC